MLYIRETLTCAEKLGYAKASNKEFFMDFLSNVLLISSKFNLKNEGGISAFNCFFYPKFILPLQR
jgi:hypothetical protein